MSPKQRARRIIDYRAHRDYRPWLPDYLGHALRSSHGRRTLQLMDEALSCYARAITDYTMLTRPAPLAIWLAIPKERHRSTIAIFAG